MRTVPKVFFHPTYNSFMFFTSLHFDLKRKKNFRALG
jgi:hypothetical protein